MEPAAALRAAQHRVAAITLAEIMALLDDPVTRRIDSETAQQELASLSSRGGGTLSQRPYADPFYWAAFTVNGC
jgi:CHAT domain-containing protein